MVYLIGGSPRCGKTTLAKALSKSRNIPYVPADYLMSVITPFISDDEYERKLPLRTIRKKTNRSNDALYSSYSAEQIVGFYLYEAETLWPGIVNFINYALHDDHDFIVEGWQLLPGLISKLITPENEPQIRAVFLYKEDEAAILSSLKASTAQNDWAVKNTEQETTYRAIAHMVGTFGAYIKGECQEGGFQAVPMESNFKQTIDALVESF